MPATYRLSTVGARKRPVRFLIVQSNVYAHLIVGDYRAMGSQANAAQTANLIRTGSAARMLGCSRSHLLALVRTGKIRAQQFDGYFLFDAREIERCAAARQQSPTTRTTDAAPTYRHHGNSIVAVLRQSSEPRVAVTAADINAGNREFYAAEAARREMTNKRGQTDE
jgi:hypothetical protein